MLASASGVAVQAGRRRTFAVISHPDAGKSTMTEALALHARVIGRAGAVHGKGDRRGVVSDWMAMEQQRGISVTSAALQFSYRDTVINLLDTPGIPACARGQRCQHTRHHMVRLVWPMRSNVNALLRV